MSESNIYQDFFEDILIRYRKNQVSALIGAGFSKNITPMSPNWDELLYDMIIELYDHEIEVSYTNHIHQNRLSKRKNLKEDFKKQYAKRLCIKHGYLNIVSKYIEKHGYRECIELYIEKRIPYLNLDSNTVNYIDGRIEEIKVSDIEVHTKVLELGLLNSIYTTNYDNFLEAVASVNQTIPWTSVSVSSKLKLPSREDKQIIKIHGSIRPSFDDNFCFDGCYKHRYVISKDDYIDYPKDHEAFMQLMRISLLRESFILFGFSGQDPNFIAWVKWVRDILLKSDSMNNSDANYLNPRYYKIFLFDVSRKEPTPESMQFYINHRIKHIPILHHDVLSFLGINDEDKSDNQLIKEVFISIFDKFRDVDNGDFLSLHETTNTPASLAPEYKADDIKQRATDNEPYNENTITEQEIKGYSKLWGRVTTSQYVEKDGIKQPLYTVNNEVLDQIVINKSNNRLIRYVSHQENVLANINRYDVSSDMAKLMVYAINDVKYPIDYYSRFNLEERIRANLSDENALCILNMYNQRQNILKSIQFDNPKELSDYDIDAEYNTILSAAFALDFSKLKKMVTDWHPKGYLIQNKAALLAMFDGASAKKLLLEYRENESRVKERYYATSLLNIINHTIPAQYSTSEYENLGIDSLWTIKDYFISELKKTKQEIKPYGWSGNTYHIGEEHVKCLTAIRFVNFLIDSGLPVQLGFFYCVDNKDWYIVSKEIYELYPCATLWFTLQCSDDSVLKRISQEYAYSDTLSSHLPYLVDSLFNAYFNEDTPSYIKTNILKFLPPLFIVVPAKRWEQHLKKIWIDEYINKLEDAYTDINIKPFINACLPYIQSDSIKNRIIEDCIKSFGKENNNLIDAIYYLNLPKKAVARVSNNINKLINKISTSDDFLILANLHSILSNNQIDSIGLKLIELSQNEVIFSYRTIPALSFFANNNSIKSNDALQCVKGIILNNNDLWDIGIKDKSATEPNYIDLSRINQWIEWSAEEINMIYTKLVESFSALKQSVFFNDDEKTILCINYVPLLTEMYKFIIDNSSIIQCQDDFISIKNDIKEELNKRRNFATIENGLWSSDRNAVISAINEVIDIAKTGEVQICVPYIDIMIDRIIFKKAEGLISCMHVAFYYIIHNPHILYNDKIEAKLLTILDNYKDDQCQILNLDVAKAFKELSGIAEFMSDKSVESEILTYWLNMKDRFIYTY